MEAAKIIQRILAHKFRTYKTIENYLSMANKLKCSVQTQEIVVSVLKKLGALSYRSLNFEKTNDI